MMPPRSVIVYGPHMCGKTRNAERLRKGFGMDRVIDGWHVGLAVPQRGALVLTNDPASMAAHDPFEFVTFDDAMARVEP